MPSLCVPSKTKYCLDFCIFVCWLFGFGLITYYFCSSNEKIIFHHSKWKVFFFVSSSVSNLMHKNSENKNHYSFRNTVPTVGSISVRADSAGYVCRRTGNRSQTIRRPGCRLLPRPRQHIMAHICWCYASGKLDAWMLSFNHTKNFNSMYKSDYSGNGST